MVTQRVCDVLQNHVTLELEAIDRLYLNGYVPQVQYEGGVIRFLRQQLGARYLSTAMVAPLTERFVGSIETRPGLSLTSATGPSPPSSYRTLEKAFASFVQDTHLAA
jgi:hypothetical protein